MEYKLNKIVLALSLLPVALNATAYSIEVYQSELAQLELTQLAEAPVSADGSSTTDSLYWTKSNTAGSDAISCVLTEAQTPYLVTQQNSFTACLVNNFNIDIIDNQVNMDELPKLGLDSSARSTRNVSIASFDDSVISEHLISWFMPENESADVSLQEVLAQGFVIELPSRGDVLINNIRIYPSSAGFSVQGKVAGDEYSSVFLHFNGQYWNGSIHTGNEVFTVSAETESQLLLQLRQLTEFDEHDDAPEMQEHELEADESFLRNEIRSSGQSTIDIVVVYSSVYASRFNGSDSKIRAAIETRVAEANVIYQNSNINQKIVLLGYKEISLKDSVRSGSDVARSSEAKAMRDEYGADLVSFWTVNGSAGSAQNYSGSSSNAYNTSRKNDIETRYTFVHELGHSMGAKHDRQTYVEKGRGNELKPSLYKYGKSFDTYRTVMSYDNCTKNSACNRIMHFTNPRVDYRGVATGIAYSSSNPINDKINGPADNARRLNETRASIANFKTRKKIYTGGGVVTPTPRVTPTPVVVTPTPRVTPTPVVVTPTPRVTPTPVTGVAPFIAGKTKANNGEVFSYSGACFKAKNSPGSWETPSSASWFWTEVACEGAVVTPTPVVITPTPVVSTPTPVVVTPTPVIVTPPPVGGSGWSASKVYNSGDTAVVKGVTYVAGWWTKGEEPGTTGKWGVWKEVK